MSTSSEYISPTTRMQALLGTLPYLAFGLAGMIGNLISNYSMSGHDVEMVMYALGLIGLLIGWIHNFPLWSYGYLGISLLIAWFNTDVSINGVRWGYRIWLPLIVIVLLAMLWRRSLEPLRTFFRDVWNDWTRLTFLMYALGGFMALIYDESHNPYPLLFMAGSTLIVAAGAWFFLRSSTLVGRILSIAVGFILGMGLIAISYLTWDWRAYYGLSPADTWGGNLGVAPIGVLFWLLILFWPVVFVPIQWVGRRWRG